MSAKSHGRAGRPWRRIRDAVLTRDPYCMIRGPRCTGISTTVDHSVPLSVRPDLAHVPSNLRGACEACNYAGGARITNARKASPGSQRRAVDLAPSGRPWRQTYNGAPCPVSNHGSICGGGHLIDPDQWREEYSAAATWPDGDFAPGVRRSVIA